MDSKFSFVQLWTINRYLGLSNLPSLQHLKFSISPSQNLFRELTNTTFSPTLGVLFGLLLTWMVCKFIGSGKSNNNNTTLTVKRQQCLGVIAMLSTFTQIESHTCVLRCKTLLCKILASGWSQMTLGTLVFENHHWYVLDELLEGLLVNVIHHVTASFCFSLAIAGSLKRPSLSQTRCNN